MPRLQKHILEPIVIDGYLLFSDAYVLKKLLIWNCFYKLPNCFCLKQTSVSCQEAEILAAEKNFVECDSINDCLLMKALDI